jgi:hypothetical protein
MTPRCSRCRHGAKPSKVTQAMRDWWLERFTIDQIRAMAAGIWPDSGDHEATTNDDLFSTKKTKAPH